MLVWPKRGGQTRGRKKGRVFDGVFAAAGETLTLCGPRRYSPAALAMAGQTGPFGKRRGAGMVLRHGIMPLVVAGTFLSTMWAGAAAGSVTDLSPGRGPGVLSASAPSNVLTLQRHLVNWLTR